MRGYKPDDNAAIFYPFGSAVGDIQTLVNYGGEDSAPVNLARPFVYFGRTYNLIYVNYNGLLSFNQPIIEDPYTFPSNGSQDVIAPLWADFDDYGIIAFYYQQYTSGNVLTRATEDIKRYYPGLSFNATWVFVATWDYVQTWDLNTFLQHSAPSISFQAVLISDGVSSFILMNYGDMSVINYPVEAGYDTIGSTHYFVIPGSNYGNLIPNLNSSSNVNTPGRWAFSLNRGSSLENVVGLQMKVTSFLNLTDSGNLAFVMQKLKDELVNRGMPSNVRVTARKVQKTKP
nr:sushi, nidogen and EGF-like domain-containing protein 1 [Misgurnus anguillicaudatus]